MRSIKFRDGIYKKIKLTIPNTIQYLNLKQNLITYNRILKGLIREAKYSYYKTKFDHYKSNSKETWRTINEIINKSKGKSGPDYLLINGHKISDKIKLLILLIPILEISEKIWLLQSVKLQTYHTKVF